MVKLKSKIDRDATVVIYWCTDDECYIAHSLEMDQIGDGNRVVEALASLIRAIDLLVDEAKKDPSINIFRRAPDDILELASKAERLPHEVCEIAHKMATGNWPDGLILDVRPAKPSKIEPATPPPFSMHLELELSGG